MSVEFFVDTNILLYAHDREAGHKNRLASEIVRKGWEERSGAVSTQVLQEFYVNLRRRADPPFSRGAALRLVENYLGWHVVTNDVESIRRAVDLEGRFGFSFWDALILDAAINSGARILYTEDLSHGQRIGALKVENPFRV